MIGWALLGWIPAVNFLAFVAFGVDKSRARNGKWRLSERYLLLLAAGGGWVGAKAGQRWFRHKTRKQPFASLLNAALAVPVLAILALNTPVLPMLAKSLALDVPHSGVAADRPFPRRFGPGSDD